MILTLTTPTAGSGPDALTLHLTGGASNVDPDVSLGGARSTAAATALHAGGLAELVGLRVNGGPPNLTIVRVLPGNGSGWGSLAAAGPNLLTWTAPGSVTPGTAVEILSGETRVIADGADADAAIVATRTSSDPLFGAAAVLCADVFNSLFGFDNVTSAEVAAGVVHYRAAMLYAAGDYGLIDLNLYLPTLGSSRTTDGAQLGASGAGTVETSGGGGFNDWEDQPAGSGFARIETSGGALREIVYYTSRTAVELTVPSGGRGLLGSSAGAGAADDVVYPVPGIRIALEKPDGVIGAQTIQTIADDETAPTGVSWNTGISASGGLNLPSLSPGHEYGLWLHRHVP